MRSHLVLSAMLVLICGATYAATLAPTVTGEDSGELIAAAHFFGIPHPPGYPLWTILCGLFIRAMPLGDVAWRANLFSAICASLSTIPLFSGLRLLKLSRPAAMASSLVWALSGTLWSQSVITEVYGLHALLATLLLWTTIKWFCSKERRWLVASAFVFGLGMSNHHTTAFIALPLVCWIIGRSPALIREWRLITKCLAVFAIALLPYVYLPIRASAEPPMNWGNPATAGSLWDHVSRSQYGSMAPLKVDEGRSLGRFFSQAKYVVGVVCRDMTLPIFILALLGLIWLVFKKPDVGLLVLFWLISCGPLFLLIANIDLDRKFRHAMQVFFIPISLALSLPLAFSLDRLGHWIRRRAIPFSQPAAAALALAVPLIPLYSNFDRCDYSNYRYAFDHAKAILASTLPNALIFPASDHNTFPLTYLNFVEGVRPDVDIADKYGYVDRAVVEETMQATQRQVDVAGMDDNKLKSWLILNARRPVYYTTKSASPVQSASFVPVGVLYHLLPKGKAIDQDGPWQDIAYRNLEDDRGVTDIAADHILGDFHFFRALDQLRRNRLEEALKNFETAARHIHSIKEGFNNIGSALAEHNRPVEAIPYFQHAAALDAKYLTPQWNLVRLYENLGRLAQAERALQDIAIILPDDHRVYRRLGFIAHELHDNDVQAREYWKRSLSLFPDQADLKQLINADP